MFKTSLLKVKKRNGEVADFDANKIAIAIQKATTQTKGSFDSEMVKATANSTLVKLGERFTDKTPSVEDVQNAVEQTLMEAGSFDIAKSYIIYRYEHQKRREVKKREVQEKIEEGGLYIVKRSGQKELFQVEKLKASLKHAVGEYSDVIDINVIANQVRSEIHEDITSIDIERATIMVLRSWIEQDPAYSFVAARVLLMKNYKDVIGLDNVDVALVEKQLRDGFTKKITQCVALGKLDPRMLTFDIERLAKELDFTRDNNHTYLSAQTLVDRYFLRDAHTKEVLETPQTFWMRVAMGLSLGEKEDRNERAIEFYNVMSSLLFVPSTPTLFHAGTTHPQLSSCYLTTIEDSLTHIFKSISDNAQLSKWSGGIGNDWTNLRGIGALIKGTGVSSQGTIPFLKIANDTTAAINRSGRRRGATCAYLETWHWDIEDFLELRKNTGDERRRTHDMNTSNWIPDLFMKRVKEDGQWCLFSSDETPDLHHLYGKAFEKRYKIYEEKGAAGELVLFKVMKARDLWKKMLTMLFETGHPWITFKDPCNVRSPQDHVGVVHSSNLCTEITLNTSADETAVCNLGSVNLERHVTNGAFDKTLVAKTVKTAMRMLDNVIDVNFYPTKEAKNSNMRHRPIGLGVMGFQNALYKLGINFNSDEAVQFADESQEIVSYHAIHGSAMLAKERGPYSTFKGSKWDRNLFPVDTLTLLEEERGMKIGVDRVERLDWAPVRAAVQMYGMRNSNTMAVAPTATISNITGTTPTIEPIYKNIYVKSNQAGDFTIVNPYLVAELKELNLWDSEMLGKLKYNDGRLGKIQEIPQNVKDKYKETFEVGAEWMVKVAAYRGKWIDQSQSFNVFYAGSSGREIANIYMHAWEMGLKTTYYMRTLAVSQVEKSTVKISKYGETHKRSSEVEKTATSAPVAVQTPKAPAPQAVKVAQPVAEVQLCRIEDPDCEACQ
jgi:ribonucleoside-diphosphate reductase alpha chain